MSDLPLRAKMIRLAASMPKGSSERKALLDVLAADKAVRVALRPGIRKQVTQLRTKASDLRKLREPPELVKTSWEGKADFALGRVSGRWKGLGRLLHDELQLRHGREIKEWSEALQMLRRVKEERLRLLSRLDQIDTRRAPRPLEDHERLGLAEANDLIAAAEARLLRLSDRLERARRKVWPSVRDAEADALDARADAILAREGAGA